MRIDPDHPDLLVLTAIEFRHTRNGPHCDRVIPSQHQWSHPFLERLPNRLCGPGAGIRDLLQIAGVRAAEVLRFGEFDGDVAAIQNAVPERLKTGFQTCNAHRRGSHVHPAPAGPHVERNAKHSDVARRK